MTTKAVATIVQSGICRTTARHRPFPTLFYFPGLTSEPFHNPEKLLPWCRDFEACTVTIRAEYEALVRAHGGRGDYAPQDGEHRLHEGTWEWHSYVLKGARQEAFREACPTTAALLDAVPGQMLGTPFAYAFFSTLRAGSAIQPHTAPCNLRLRCHLPLAVPSDDPELCGMRVGDETRPWREGRLTVFDDSYEHETWNRSQGDRVVLLFDVWHPELAQEECAAVADMFSMARDKGWLKG